MVAGCLCRPLQRDEEDVLREALLASGTDPEASVDSSRKRRRSWYSLLGTAIAYVWPGDTRWLVHRLILAKAASSAAHMTACVLTS